MFEVLSRWGFLGRVRRFSLNCVEIRVLVTFGNYFVLCFSTFIDFCEVLDLFQGQPVTKRYGVFVYFVGRHAEYQCIAEGIFFGGGIVSSIFH